MHGHQTRRPFPDTHPEFTVTHWKAGTAFTEYRVAHWRLARDGSGRIVHGTAVWSWVDMAVVLVVAWLLRGYEHALFSRPVLLGVGFVLTYIFFVRFTQVLHESLLVFPTLGIQLETHRGHPLLPPLSITRHFIPLSSLQDLVIHEGFQRWNVRYYIAALQRRPHGIEVHVAFENVLPYFPVLREVYLGVQQTLFPPPTRIVNEE